MIALSSGLGVLMISAALKDPKRQGVRTEEKMKDQKIGKLLWRREEDKAQ